MSKALEKALKERLEAKAKNAVIAVKDEGEDENAVAKFFKALANKDVATLRALSDGQNVTNDGDGGYLVPTELSAQIIEKLNYVSPLRQIITVIPNMPAILDLPLEDALPTTYWVGEGVAPTSTKSTFTKKTLKPFKMGGFVKFTYESLNDTATNPALQNFVSGRIANSLALRENDAFVNGNGTDRPLGFRDSSFKATTGAVATAGKLGYKDIVKAFMGVHPSVRANGVWVMPTHALEQVIGLSDEQGRPIYVPAVSENAPATILGKPVYEVPEIPENLGTNKNETEIWFGDFKNYIAGDREGMRVQFGTTGTDLESDIISLVVFKRVAGMPTQPLAFYKLTGVPTGLPAGK